MNIKADYYDGVSAQEHRVNVVLRQNMMIITSDESEPPVHAVWNISQIHKLEFITETGFSLCYGDEPVRTLNLTDKNVYEELKKAYPGAAFLKSPYKRIFSLHHSLLWASGPVLLLLLLLFYFFGLPHLVRVAVQKIPIGQEQLLGKSLFAKIAKNHETDTLKTNVLKKFVHTLKFEDSNMTPQVLVIKGEEANAFALPGGFIVMYDSIIDIMRDYSELAALLGHEYAHSYLRHTTSSAVQSVAVFAIISLLFGDVTGFIAILVENGETLRFLDYSRKLEREADLYCQRFLIENNISILGAENLLVALQNHSQSVSWELLSTHPAFKARIDLLRETRKNFPPRELTERNDSLRMYFQQLKTP